MADFFAEFKTCPACGDRFYRPRSCSPSKWAPQITCSVDCAKDRRAGKVAKQPAGERRSGGGDDWRHRAACRGEVYPDRFFPVGTSGPALLELADAKAVCARCPVVSECLDYAMANGLDAGVFGGLSEDERRSLKRRNARKSAVSA